jgi:transcriptional regulator with XRE-family HTH domain
MVNRTERNYRDTGLRLKAIREELRMTLDGVSKETGLSRSYISDFERGFRLPTSKYLRYLHDYHKVNLNFIFGGEDRKFRAEISKPPNFGRLQEDVDELLEHMAEIPHALFAVLGFFTEYKVMNKEIIRRYRSEKAVESKDAQ